MLTQEEYQDILKTLKYCDEITENLAYQKELLKFTILKINRVNDINNLKSLFFDFLQVHTHTLQAFKDENDFLITNLIQTLRQENVKM